MQSKPIVLQLPDAVRDLWRAQQAVARHYDGTGLKFTLDGRLVGDIGEALALHCFDLVLPLKRTGGVDALTKSCKTVQVKATGSADKGPAFSRGKGSAHYLLFFQIDFRAGMASVLYNGLEAPIRTLLPTRWDGTKVVQLAALRELAKLVRSADALPLARP
jgi:hypothetical protein